MGDFEKALVFVLRVEGGYVNDTSDPGGATNNGVTQKTYDSWRIEKGLPKQDVKLITMDEVTTIYKERYWLKAECNKMVWPYNLLTFDFAVNAGVKKAVELYSGNAHLFLLRRIWFYVTICSSDPKLLKFFFGWIKRVKQLSEFAEIIM